MRSRTPLVVLVFLTAACSWTQALRADTDAPAGPDLENAWRAASMGLVSEARAAFTHADSREARFGEAITLLLVQPKTDSNVERAARLLNDIIRTGETDDLGLIARYHLGRLEQAHRTPPDLSAATAHYRKLRELSPSHPLAEQALVKLGIIELYAPDINDDRRRALYDDYGRQADKLVTSDSRRDLHFLLAQVGQRYRFDKTSILNHYLASEKEGIRRTITRADVYVSIVQLARDLGRNPVARQYSDKFLAEFLRDNRRLMIQEIRDALPEERSAPPSQKSA
ncbi:hypothetical protein OPIT5_06625 [Opitutaceae bacterium TAV5]|nr:hypothetical protein OPIT5_06625 [Opitutaceae bacterium TAV5]